MHTLIQNDEKLQTLMHHRETMEKVAREMLTAVDPSTQAALGAILDLCEADRDLTVELFKRLQNS